MNIRAKIIRMLSLTVIGLSASTVSASAQQSTRLAVDSVSKHLRSHPKPKKEAVTPLAAKTPAAAKSKAKREVPPIILPAAQTAEAKPAAKRTTSVAGDSVPAVRRAATVSKKKPSR